VDPTSEPTLAHEKPTVSVFGRRRRRRRAVRLGWAVTGLAALALVAAACGGGSSGGGCTAAGRPRRAARRWRVCRPPRLDAWDRSWSTARDAPSTCSRPTGRQVALRRHLRQRLAAVPQQRRPTGRGPALSAACSAPARGATATATQVTYHGHPLYYYAGDSEPGDTAGQGLDQFGAKWFVLAPTATRSPAEAAGGQGSGLHDPEPVGDGGRLDPVADAELAEDVGDVHGGRLGADEQRLGDLGVGPPERHQRQHLLLAGGEAEAVERRGGSGVRRRGSGSRSRRPRRARASISARSGAAPSPPPSGARPAATARPARGPTAAEQQRLGLAPAGVAPSVGLAEPLPGLAAAAHGRGRRAPPAGPARPGRAAPGPRCGAWAARRRLPRATARPGARGQRVTGPAASRTSASSRRARASSARSAAARNPRAYSGAAYGVGAGGPQPLGHGGVGVGRRPSSTASSAWPRTAAWRTRAGWTVWA
jgi:hypothetical protein